MARTARLTIELPEEDFARLEAESRREGLRPEAKVIELITRGLPPARDGFSAALARLSELRAGMPVDAVEVDAVEIVRAGRRELEDRFTL
jgi:hypothetical protein